jgi:DNA end-binding protein Ku
MPPGAGRETALPRPDNLPEPDEQEEVSTRPFWSGTITFGLVSIPVALFPANRNSRVSLRMIGPRGRPLSRRYYSEKTGRDLSSDDIVRGYEIEKGRYIEITDEELDRLAPEKSRDIDLRRFVKESEIPRLYFERGYFLTPAGESTKAYRLLAETMQRTGRAGIATFVMRGKEYLVAIVAENGILRAETLRFSDEIRSPEAIGLPPKTKPAAARVRTFEKIIDQQSTDNLPRKEMHDEEADRIRKLVEKKSARKESRVSAPGTGEPKPKVVDLLEALQARLAEAGTRQRRTESDGGDLESRSRADLYEEAKRLNISGRSSMTRDQLIKAIRNAA